MWAIITVAILHALLAYAFVSGLAYKFIKSQTEDLKVVDVKEAPPPPDEPPPPPPPDQPSSPPMTTQPTVLQTPTPPQVITPPTIRPPIATPVPPTPPAPPAPVAPPVRTVPPQRARTSLASYFSNDDYPAAAQRAEAQGRTGFTLVVGPTGRVTDCTVTSSSGNSALDQATCRILRSRARYTPARDSSGNPTSGRDSGSVTWRLPAGD